METVWNVHSLWKSFIEHLNFFRIHLLFFTFTPLIFSGIFYASNGQNHVHYIDALFLCVSASTVCGLATVELSAITTFQQVLLFVQAAIGNPVVVSWVMVYVRRWYFLNKLEGVVEARKRADQERDKRLGINRMPLRKRLTRAFTRYEEKTRGDITNMKEKSSMKPLGNLWAGPNDNLTDMNNEARDRSVSFSQAPVIVRTASPEQIRESLEVDRYSSDTHATGSDHGNNAQMRRVNNTARFQPMLDVLHDDVEFIPPTGKPIMRRPTRASTVRRASLNAMGDYHRTKNKGMGGFPYPTHTLLRLVERFLPKLSQSLTIPRTRTNASQQEYAPAGTYSYLSFSAIIYKNSAFRALTEDQLEELGGVEFRALNALLWIVGLYHVLSQLFCFIIIAPYLSLPRWRSVFEPPNLHKYVSPVWYSAFQVVSAYTTLGMSLVDQSMVPFQEAYPLIYACTFLIFAGNLAFPILLRFTIWATRKVSPSKSRLKETLQFLLDHPRRCFFYLFPARHTWVLLVIVIVLNSIDWFFFMVLNIGDASFESIPLGVRFAIGPLQATSARAAGFSTVSLTSIAPALQVLFVIIMYIGIYPIALSIRSTNVYEEKSLGVYEEEEEEEEEEPNIDGPEAQNNRVSVWGRYLAWHARQQLSFDIWCLCLSLFLLCIIERAKLQNTEFMEWFTIFSILFELISAYTGVGMSLGVPYANFSFSGALTPGSKIIIIAMMLRGRHRGLPVAIDRAVTLPMEYGKTSAAQDNRASVSNDVNVNIIGSGNSDQTVEGNVDTIVINKDIPIIEEVKQI